jgi:hypothetical protein
LITFSYRLTNKKAYTLIVRFCILMDLQIRKIQRFEDNSSYCLSTFLRRSRFPLIAFIVWSLFLISGCNQEQPLSAFPPAQPNIVPASSPEFPLTGTGVVETEPVRTTGILNQPKVILPANLIAHQTIDLNLDGDEIDEQIIIVKQREDPEDLIRLVVVDYDMARGSYFISWIGATRSTNLRALTVYADDITGNQLPEIIVLGLNNQGEQTLDIFQWNINSAVFGLQYRSILSIQADVGIEIQTPSLTGGFSKNVVTVNRDLSSDNPLDTLRSTYFWRPQENRFVLGSTEAVSGANIVQTQLADLYSANEQVFMNFLRGPWYRVTPNANVEDPRNLQIIHINPERNSLAFFRPGRTLPFTWAAITKAPFGGRVRIDMRNQIIPSVQSIANINLQSLDTFTLSLTGTDAWSFFPNEWNGEYRRMPPTTQQAQLLNRNLTLGFNHIRLSGLFQSADNSELFFSNPNLILRTNGVEENGGYAIFSYGNDTILQIMFLNRNGTISRAMDFRIEFEEESMDDVMKRTLVLEPVQLTASGITPAGGGRMQFEQRVTIAEAPRN